MTNKGVKLLVLGFTVVLFSLVLVFASFVFLLSDAAHYVIASPRPIGGCAVGIVWLALIVGVVGLAVAFLGFDHTD